MTSPDYDRENYHWDDFVKWGQVNGVDTDGHEDDWMSFWDQWCCAIDAERNHVRKMKP